MYNDFTIQVNDKMMEINLDVCLIYNFPNCVEHVQNDLSMISLDILDRKQAQGLYIFHFEYYFPPLPYTAQQKYNLRAPLGYKQI